MKVGIKLGKVKKFGIGWCIPHRMAADNAEGGSGQTPPLPGFNRVKTLLDWLAQSYTKSCGFTSLLELFMLLILLLISGFGFGNRFMLPILKNRQNI